MSDLQLQDHVRLISACPFSASGTLWIGLRQDTLLFSAYKSSLFLFDSLSTDFYRRAVLQDNSSDQAEITERVIKTVLIDIRRDVICGCLDLRTAVSHCDIERAEFKHGKIDLGVSE